MLLRADIIDFAVVGEALDEVIDPLVADNQAARLASLE